MKNIDLVRKEFSQARNKWTQIVLNRAYFYRELRFRLLERKFQTILFFTTIAVAFLSFVLPFSLNSLFKISVFTVIVFLLSSLLGFIRILISLMLDVNQIPKDEKWELDVLTEFQKLASEIYDEALNEKIDQQKIEKYFSKDTLNDKIIERGKLKKPKEKIFEIFYWVVLFLFFIGFLSLSFDISRYFGFIQ